MEKVIKIFTDGACSLRTKKGTWAALIDRDNKLQFYYGIEGKTTNQRMEVLAAIKGLEQIKHYRGKIHVYTDSMYLKNGITSWIHNWIKRGWLKRDGNGIKNKDLWKGLYHIVQNKDIRWIWVKGHSGNIGNNLVDSIAEYSLNNLESED